MWWDLILLRTELGPREEGQHAVRRLAREPMLPLTSQALYRHMEYPEGSEVPAVARAALYAVPLGGLACWDRRCLWLAKK